MTMLEELYEKYRKTDFSDLTSKDKKYLRENLQLISKMPIVSIIEAEKFLNLLRIFRQAIKEDLELQGEKFNDLLNNLLTVGENGVYSDSLRCLYELIQNVDDCEYENRRECNLTIRFEKNGLEELVILEYNEKGFTPENVFSITGIAEQSKNIIEGQIQIGEKGIGFKSVFGVAKKVLIQSDYFSFELEKDNFTVPIPKYHNYKKILGTKMTLFLIPNKAEELKNKLLKDYKQNNDLFNKNPIIFLNKLTKLEIKIDDNTTILFYISNKTSCCDKYKPHEEVLLSSTIIDKLNGKEFKKSIDCLRYTMPVVYDLKDCQSRYGEKTKVAGINGKRMFIYCIVPKPTYLKEVKKGSFYSFLPTQIKLNIPIIIHAPFKLDTSREYVDSQGKNAWFLKTCEALGELLQRMYLDFARIVKGQIIKYLPSRKNGSVFEQANDDIRCLYENKDFISERFLDLPLYYTNDTQLSYNTDIVCINPEEVKNENYENEIRLIYKLLGEKKPLFISPRNSTIKELEDVNLKVISNIDKLIFEQAFYNKEVTKEALKYLSEKKVDFKISDIENMNNHNLDIAQLKEFILYKEYLDLIKKYSKKTIEEKTVLPKFNLSPCQELENAFDINDKYNEELDVDSAKIEIINYLKEVKRILILKSKEPIKTFYICLKNVLILSEDYKSSFADLRKAFNDKDFYSAMISMEKKSDEIYSYEKNTNITILDFLKELSQLRRATKKILGQENYKKYTDIILESGKDSKRFIKELLQNADDCDFPADVKPTFVLEYKQNDKSKMIHTKCNENGFTKSNIRAITAIGESTKKKILENNKEKTGEKGVGFKTVFGVAKEVTIRSEDISFKLTREEPTIPIKFQNINKINGSEMEFLLEDDYKLSFLTEKEVLQLCVCLHNLKEISINNFKVTISDNELERQIKINDKNYTLIKKIYSFEVNDDTILTERSKNGIKKINKKQSICCYFFKNGNPEGFEFKLYSSLATNITIYNNLIIDAPFELTTSRDEIIHNRWNELIRNYLYNAIKNTLEKHKAIINKNVLKYIKINEQCNSSISSDNWLNNIYYLNLFMDCKFLPTYVDNVFVSPNEKCKLIPPVVKYILDKGEELDIQKDKILNLSVSKENPIYKAFEFSYIDDNIVLSLIAPYINKYIVEEKFRGILYPYLVDLNKMELIPVIKNFNIFPVYSQDGKFDYIKWQNNIYTEKDIYKSGENYLVLNETILSKNDCEKILGDIRIKEMSFDLIKSDYNNLLYNGIINEVSTEKAYHYILEEFNNGNIEKYEAKYTTVKRLFEENKLPLKNVLEEYIVGKPLFIDDKDSFPYCNILRKITLSSEAIDFANYCLNYNKNLYEIHFDDLWSLDNNPKKLLTCDDIEAFYSDYFKNKYEIMRNLIQNNFISLELIEKYNLDYFSNDYRCSENDEEGNFEFPNSDSIDFNSLHKSYLNRFENPEKIIIQQVIKEVKKVNYKGKLSDINSDTIRKETIDRYSVSNGECFCQFCEKLKPKKYIEVNNIERDPKYYWKEMRIALCLECSKEFEAIRRNDLLYKDFIKEILSKDLQRGSGSVEVEIGAKDGDSIKFSRQHLAEIQEILRFQQNKSNVEDEENE